MKNIHVWEPARLRFFICDRKLKAYVEYLLSRLGSH